jgi:hypothetical protein
VIVGKASRDDPAETRLLLFNVFDGAPPGRLTWERRRQAMWPKQPVGT